MTAFRDSFHVSTHLGIYDSYTYVLKDLPMGRALVAKKRAHGEGYDPLGEREKLGEPYVEFANVQIENEDAILDYANSRGVPFNPNRVYDFVKVPKSSQVANRAVTGIIDYEMSTSNIYFETFLNPREDLLKETIYEKCELAYYRKFANGPSRTYVYPLDDFRREVIQMRHILKLKAVPLAHALNEGIAGVKVATFVTYNTENGSARNKPLILRKYVPIDFKQALYVALLEGTEARVSIGECKYKRCHCYFIVDHGKVYCSKRCQNKSCRMRHYYRNKKEANHGKKTRKG